jgi:hypothetical protein
MGCGEVVQKFGGSFANIAVPMVAFVVKKNQGIPANFQNKAANPPPSTQA